MQRLDIGSQACEHRAVGHVVANLDGTREAKNTAEKTGEFAAFPRRKQVRDNGEGGGKQRSAAKSLNCPEHDQLHHADAEQRQVAELAGEPGKPPNFVRS